MAETDGVMDAVRARGRRREETRGMRARGTGTGRTRPRPRATRDRDDVDARASLREDEDVENALQALRVASGGEGVVVDEVMVDDGDMVTATGTMIVRAPPAEGANGRRGGKKSSIRRRRRIIPR